MEGINTFFTRAIAGYFEELPVPKSLGGFLDLKFSEWVRLGAFVGMAGAGSYVFIQGLYSVVPEQLLIKYHIPRKSKQFWCNKDIEKHRAKVNHQMTLDEITEQVEKDGQVVLCRCWKSTTFPLCDKAHRAHNKETGDNSGPFYIRKVKQDLH